ncbi:unnamed protein product [Danaus chrysippus]|uniref:(African queen) hypothetical protein n=1 Tax=Danaus chrysippus TaxID=151541 RepID=A0A8J2QIB6_9NEOP|nr:unnamed protein product [Danaus chrysippus]
MPDSRHEMSRSGAMRVRQFEEEGRPGLRGAGGEVYAPAQSGTLDRAAPSSTTAKPTTCFYKNRPHAHKSYGIPAPASDVSMPGKRETECEEDLASLSHARNPFLSTCCTITKTRSFKPLPYVN